MSHSKKEIPSWLLAYRHYLKTEKRVVRKAERESRVRTAGFYLLSLLSILALSLWGVKILTRSAAAKSDHQELTIEFPAVAGDMALIRTPGKKTVLVNSGLQALEILRQQGLKKVDYLFITFPHKTNIQGATMLLKNDFPVLKIYESEHSYSAPHYDDFRAAVDESFR